MNFLCVKIWWSQQKKQANARSANKLINKQFVSEPSEDINNINETMVVNTYPLR